MSTRERAYELLQTIYYDSIDRGDMATAATAFDDAVDWSHAQVWAHHNYERESVATQLSGRKAVEEFLSERKDKLAEAKIRHKIRDLVFEGGKGAFLGAVEGEGRELAFMVWFELRNDRVSRYTLRPL